MASLAEKTFKYVLIPEDNTAAASRPRLNSLRDIVYIIGQNKRYATKTAAAPANAKSIANPVAFIDINPSLIPRYTIAVFMNHSGFADSRKKAARPLKTLPIIRPTPKANMKEKPPPNCNPHVNPYFSKWFFLQKNFIRIFRFDAILLGFILRFAEDKLFRFKYFSLGFLTILIIAYYFSENFILLNEEEYFVKIFFIIFLQILSLLTLNSFLIFEPFMKFKLLKQFSILVSKQTYSVYLIHIIFIYILANVQFSILNTVLIYIILLFFSSSLIFYSIEKPLLKMRPKLK